MTFTELFRQAGLPKTSLHRTLNTLTRQGLLRQDPHTKTFKLGTRLLELAHEVWSDFDLRLAAQDELSRLRDAQEETVLLATLAHDKALIVACEQAGRLAAISAAPGASCSLFDSALGQAMAAHLDPVRQKRLLDEAAAHFSPAEAETWREGIQSVWNLTSARGYAIAQNDMAQRCQTLATAVFDIEGRPVGAIAVVAELEQLTAERLHGLASELMGVARRVANNAGGEALSILETPAPTHRSTARWECVVKTRSLLGEGPVWSTRDAALYWVDILTPAIHLHSQANNDGVTPLGSMVSLALPKSTGGLVLATPSGVMTCERPGGVMTKIAHPDAERTNNRYNDGKCDRLGRLWLGSMDMGAQANRGGLFKVEADGSATCMDSGFTVANGLAWSPDQQSMYFTDSFRRTIYKYAFDLDAGLISHRKPWLVFGPDEGTPDGLTVDQDGCLWVAMWDAWSVAQFSPQGKELMRVRLPIPRPTSCCFGGEQLDTLYVTSASIRMSAKALATAPLSGSVFALRIPGVRGLPEMQFAG